MITALYRCLTYLFGCHQDGCEIDKLFCMFALSSRQANVIAMKACIRHNDHIVIVMPYFELDRFQVRLQGYCLECNIVVLLWYSKPTPKPRFFAKTVRRRNLGFFPL